MLKLGDKFASFEEFQSKLKEYEKTVFTNYWTRDSVTLKKQFYNHPQGLAAKASPGVKYYSLRLFCIKGGRRYGPKQRRRQALTFKQGCQAGMFLRISKCGQFLELVELNEEHNHVMSQALFNALPKRTGKKIKEPRKLSREKLKVLLHKNLKHKPELNLGNDPTENELHSSVTSNLNQKVHRHDKIKIMNEECFKLANTCLNITIDTFQERLRVIRNLVNEWSNVGSTSDDEKTAKKLVKPKENNFVNILDITNTPLVITENMEICEISEESED